MTNAVQDRPQPSGPGAVVTGETIPRLDGLPQGLLVDVGEIRLIPHLRGGASPGDQCGSPPQVASQRTLAALMP
jgi:hypothetical protein